MNLHRIFWETCGIDRHGLIVYWCIHLTLVVPYRRKETNSLDRCAHNYGLFFPVGNRGAFLRASKVFSLLRKCYRHDISKHGMVFSVAAHIIHVALHPLQFFLLRLRCPVFFHTGRGRGLGDGESLLLESPFFAATNGYDAFAKICGLTPPPPKKKNRGSLTWTGKKCGWGSPTFAHL